MGLLTGKKLMPSEVHTATHLPIMSIAKGFLNQSEEVCPVFWEDVG